ncbi:MAG: mechanosensitive ion channel family protein, partial [Ekhidna sp.]|nr:mechanosensitive ion channel family protein [Ekhidna sp.]
INIVSIYLAKAARKTDSSLDDQLVPLLRKTLKAFVITIGTLFVLDNLNIPILPLLTGLSIGGLAFALAAQDTLKNFFGSIMIFIDKPFQVGDWITSGDVDGTVEEVGFRSSRIRTFRNSIIYVPNSKLADNVIDNHGLRSYRRFYTQLTITYDTPPELIEIFVKGLRKIVDEHPVTWKENYHIYFNDMASFSLNIMFYIFFSVPTWGEELRARHEVLMSIVKLAKELGVNFAFPTQTLHVENLPGQPSLSPSYMQGNEAYSKLRSFLGKN